MAADKEPIEETDSGASEESSDLEAPNDARKSFFGRGALFGLIGGAAVALVIIGAVGSVVSLFDDVFGSTTAAEAGGSSVEVDPVVAAGEALATSNGCVACHSSNGTDLTGPTWRGLSTSVDESYIRASILDPNSVIAEGYTEGVMPLTYADSLSEDDLTALVAYISSL